MKMPTSIGRKTIGNTIRTLVYFAFTIVWKRCYLRTFIWTFHFACNTFEIQAYRKTFQFPLDSTTFSSCISISKWDNFAYYFIVSKSLYPFYSKTYSNEESTELGWSKPKVLFQRSEFCILNYLANFGFTTD